MIVAAAGGVQHTSGGSDLFGQTPFDVHMDVFVGSGEAKMTLLDLGFDRLEPAHNLLRITGRNDALLAQHFRMRDAAHDIVAIKTGVDIDRCGKGFHRRNGTGSETPTPKFFLFYF